MTVIKLTHTKKPMIVLVLFQNNYDICCSDFSTVECFSHCTVLIGFHTSFSLSVDHRLRPRVLPVRHQEEVAAVHEHKEHNPQAIRWTLQGHLRRHLRRV